MPPTTPRVEVIATYRVVALSPCGGFIAFSSLASGVVAFDSLVGVVTTSGIVVGDPKISSHVLPSWFKAYYTSNFLRSCSERVSLGHLYFLLVFSWFVKS